MKALSAHFAHTFSFRQPLKLLLNPMFTANTYTHRREKLREKVGSGLILLLGNEDSPKNYPANAYPFRQDSNLLYFFGIDKPGVTGLLDVDGNKDFLFGQDCTLEDVVWTGAQSSLQLMAEQVGVTESGSLSQLADRLQLAQSQGRKIQFPPVYRVEQGLKLAGLINQPFPQILKTIHADLIRSIVALRSIKSREECFAIESALKVTHQAFAEMALSIGAGVYEYELVAILEKVFSSHNRAGAYPIILSVHGEILHNHNHTNRLQNGDLLLVDAGAESPEHYASDITRTFSVGDSFSSEQTVVFALVQKAQSSAIAAIKPGVPYKEIHLQAARIIAEGLKEIGLMKGNMEEAVAAGAHALFFPHGLGHMLGLDVHDMEGLGEDFVGYDHTVTRSDQFGLAHLRLAKALQPGNVLTVEPGIYFIPALMDQWEAQKKCQAFIDYKVLRSFRKAGGIRIEDDVLVTETGSRVLGKNI